MNKPKIAVVVPVYGNQQSLHELYSRIVKSFEGTGTSFAIQFVNDRSPDDSQKILEEIASADKRVRIILLSKNFGAFVAMAAGLNEALDHDAAIILSADLQDPPELIPEMVRKWKEGAKVVLCMRKSRKDPLMTRLFSLIYNYTYRKLFFTEMLKGGFDFCLLDRQVVKVITESSEKSTSLVGLILWSGFERTVIPYDRLERKHGKSMWSFKKKFQYAIDSIIAFSCTPLRIFSIAGFTLSLVCIFSILFLLFYYFVFHRITVPGWTSILLVIVSLGAFQIFGLGIIGEYLWNSLEQTRKRPLYIIDKRIGGQPAAGTSGTEGESSSAVREVPFFDVKSASAPVLSSLPECVSRVINSGQVILGREVEAFEAGFASYVNSGHCVGVANGTDALTFALWASGIGKNDLVITSSLSAPATAVAIIRAGAVPLLVDVEPVFLTIYPEAVEKAIKDNPGAKAIVPVHLYGNICDMDALKSLAEKHSLKIIEDCAQSAGSRLKGIHCGNFSSDAAAFSFYPTKNLGAIGDAGAVTMNNPGISDKVRKMRFYGQDEKGECMTAGFNSRLDEIQASFLNEKLTSLPRQNMERMEIARKYDHALSSSLNPVPSGEGRVPHLYVIRPSDRGSLAGFLLKRGIRTGIHYNLSLNRHSYLSANSISMPCRNADDAASHVLSLPCHPGLTDEMQEKVINACLEWVKKNAG